MSLLGPLTGGLPEWEASEGRKDSATLGHDSKNMSGKRCQWGKSGNGNLGPQRFWPVVICRRHQFSLWSAVIELTKIYIDHMNGREQQKLWTFQSYLHTQ